MTDLGVPQFKIGPARLLAGLRRHHFFDDAATTISEQWQQFLALGPIPGRCGPETYGLMCATDPVEGSLEYMCAVEVEDFERVPSSLGRLRLPAHTYAVFTHAGRMATIRQTWEAIWRDWLPGSGYEPAATPDFERYDERFDPAAGAGLVEIWFPIRAQQTSPSGSPIGHPSQ